MPLPRDILEAEYPDNPDIVDAHCRIRLCDDAPRWGITAKEASRLTVGWDPEQFAIELHPWPGQEGPPSPPKSPNSDVELDEDHNEKEDEMYEEHGQLPGRPVLSSDWMARYGAKFPSVPTSWPVAPSNLSTSKAPDVLLMTPIEGPDDELDDAFHDGSMTFTLAVVPASPTQIVSDQASSSTHSDTGQLSTYSQKAQPLVRTAEVETAIQTAVRLIADVRAAATAKYDRAMTAKAVPDRTSDTDDNASITTATAGPPSGGSYSSSWSTSSFVIVSSSSSSPSSFASVSTANCGQPGDIFFHKMDEDHDRNGFQYDEDDNSDSDSDIDSEEELEALLMQLLDGGLDDSKSTTSSSVTITQETVDARAAANVAAAIVAATTANTRADSEISNSAAAFEEAQLSQDDVHVSTRTPSEASSRTATAGPPTPTPAQPDLPPPPRPNHILLTDDGVLLPLCEGTKEDYIRAILQCESERSTGIKLNRNPTRFPMRQTETVAPTADAYYAYNLGPSCSWAPYFFSGKPHAGTFLPTTTHMGRTTTGDMAQVPMPYIEHPSLSDSPLGMPMGTRVINFLPDFGTNSPVRCFLHTSCDGPPPPVVSLPILDSLPSFGSANSAAQVSTLPTEPPSLPSPQRLSQRNQMRRQTSERESRDVTPVTESGSPADINDRTTSLTIAEYATAVGAYKEWTHTCIALHQIAGHMTSSRVEAAATGLADLVRHLVHNAERMGLLSQSVYENTQPMHTVPTSPPTTPIALCYKQVFWAKFAALTFAVFSEHALRMDLAAGSSDWAQSVSEAGAIEALTIPDRSQTPTPTPLTGRTYRMDGYESLDNMIPEYWWRHGRQLDQAWNNFLDEFQERQSQPRVYNEDEAEQPYAPIPAFAQLLYDEDESRYADYDMYKDFGNYGGIHLMYDMFEGRRFGGLMDGISHDEASGKIAGNEHDTDMAEHGEDENKHDEEDNENRHCGALFNGRTKALLLAKPRSLNLMAQFTAVRLRGGLRALANIIYGGGGGSTGLPIRPDSNTVLARSQFDMLQAMADDSVQSYTRLLYWRPHEGPLSHTGIRAMRQKLANTYRHPLELYSAVV